MVQFEKGLKLYTIARRRAKELGVDTSSGKMEELIQKIQGSEGNTPCFRRRGICLEKLCCWQAACGAEMSEG